VEEKGDNNLTFRFIDMFAGIGGIRLGFESAGCRCVWSNEYNIMAARTYEANFGSGEVVTDDIRNIPASAIPNFDILCAGFPCQPFSIAGVSKKKSLGMPHGFQDETQGTLFHEIVRVMKEKKPAAFFLENVKNLENHDGGNTFRIIRGAIEELGYSFFYKVINAKTLVPQNRDRIFMVGFRDPSINFEFPEMPDMKRRFSQVLEKRVNPKYTLTDHLWGYLQNYAKKHREKGNGFGFGLVDLNGRARTLSARYYKDGSEILIPQKGKNPRRLTPRECARLQGFPDTFIIPVSDTAAYRQFGNSVAVPVVKILAKELTKSLAGPKRRLEHQITLTLGNSD
jgi:DNA (cytosine-5)-methyltransferase 1